jgi:predicted dehydrogenase
MTRMRFGVVGTGFWARETHATALAAHPDTELVGVWGRSFERATDMAETLARGPDWLTDVQQHPAWDSGSVRIYASIFEPGNPFGQSEWRRSRGALWDIGPHALSILVPALGPVTHVVADHGPGDMVTVVLSHESGAASTMSLSLTAPPGSRGDSWQIFGQDRQTSMPQATTTPVEAMGACISTLLTEQSGRWQHPCDVRFGRDVVKILEAADVFLQRPLEHRVQPVR